MSAVELARAVLFATERHAGQTRKNAAKTPYITHPIRVMGLLAMSGIDHPETLCGAVLHDVVEDTATTIPELRMMFGSGVARLVEEVTCEPGLPAAVTRASQLAGLPALSAGALYIRIGDKLDNLNDVLRDPPMHWTPDKCGAYVDFVEQFLHQAMNRFDVFKPHYLLKRWEVLSADLKQAYPCRTASEAP